MHQVQSYAQNKSEVMWLTQKIGNISCEILIYISCRCQPETMYIATCGPELGHHWHWRYTKTQCGYHRLNQDSLRSLLADKWVVFAGDSITRNLYAALLRQVADPSKSRCWSCCCMRSRFDRSNVMMLSLTSTLVWKFWCKARSGLDQVHVSFVLKRKSNEIWCHKYITHV